MWNICQWQLYFAKDDFYFGNAATVSNIFALLYLIQKPPALWIQATYSGAFENITRTDEVEEKNTTTETVTVTSCRYFTFYGSLDI